MDPASLPARPIGLFVAGALAAAALLSAPAATQVAAPTDDVPSAQTAGERSCIAVNSLSGREPEGDSAVRFTTTDGRVWRNQLRGPCPGLQRAGLLNQLLIEVHGTQLCSGDQIRPVDTSLSPPLGIGAAPVCVLGNFTEVTPVPEPTTDTRRPRG